MRQYPAKTVRPAPSLLDRRPSPEAIERARQWLTALLEHGECGSNGDRDPATPPAAREADKGER